MTERVELYCTQCHSVTWIIIRNPSRKWHHITKKIQPAPDGFLFSGSSRNLSGAEHITPSVTVPSFIKIGPVVSEIRASQTSWRVKIQPAPDGFLFSGSSRNLSGAEYITPSVSVPSFIEIGPVVSEIRTSQRRKKKKSFCAWRVCIQRICTKLVRCRANDPL